MHVQIPTLVLRIGLILALGVSITHAQQGAPQSTSLTAKTSATPAQAPDIFQIQFKTTQGDFVVQVHRKWSPRGADRVFELVRVAISPTWLSSESSRASWFSLGFMVTPK